jgi:hypothetical protein
MWWRTAFHGFYVFSADFVRALARFIVIVYIYSYACRTFLSRFIFFNIEVKIFQGSRPVSALSDLLAYAVTTARGLTIIRFIENAFLTRFPPRRMTVFHAQQLL